MIENVGKTLILKDRNNRSVPNKKRLQRSKFSMERSTKKSLLKIDKY